MQASQCLRNKIVHSKIKYHFKKEGCVSRIEWREEGKREKLIFYLLWLVHKLMNIFCYALVNLSHNGCEQAIELFYCLFTTFSHIVDALI